MPKIAKLAAIIAGLAVIAALAVFLYFSFSPKSAEVLEFKLSDSVATLNLPPGSLPSGVQADALKIMEAVKDEAQLKAADGSEISIYKLEPDGLVFKKPVTVSFTFAKVGDAVPLIFFISPENDIELLGKTSIVIDRKTKRTAVSVDIGHFSNIAVSWGGLFEVEMPDITNKTVGQTFEVPVRVRKLRTTAVFQSDSTDIRREVEVLGWYLGGEYSAAGTIFPDWIGNMPYRTRIEGDNHSATSSFSCQGTNTNNDIRYYASIEYIIEMTSTHRGYEVTQPVAYPLSDIVVADAFECLEPEHEGTPGTVIQPGTVDQQPGTVSPQPQTTCPQDSDGGNNPGTRGVCLEANGARMQDECFDESTLNEWFCDVNNPGYCTSQIVDCRGGCKDGVCLP